MIVIFSGYPTILIIPKEFCSAQWETKFEKGRTMKNYVTILLLTCCVVFGSGLGMPDAIAGQPGQISGARQMNLTGEIAVAAHGYIIRGNSPSEIFTILNPNAEVLDKIIEKGKVVELKVHIVSGDNVNILEIDGKDYLK